MGFIMLLTLVCLGSGLFVVLLGIVALMTRKSDERDVRLDL